MEEKASFSVIHFSTKLSWRGGEQQITYLIEELARLGVQQTMLCPGNSVLLQRSAGLLPCFTYRKRFNYDLITAFNLNSICRKYPSPLIHVHDSTAHTIAVLSGFFFRNRTPVIVSRRVDFPINPGFLSTLKYNFPTVRRIICVSGNIMEVIKPRIRDKSKLCIIFSGIDLLQFGSRQATGKLKHDYNLPPGSILVGNTSALAPHKDYHTFIDTAEALLKSNKNFRFIIIGEGPEAVPISRYIHEKGLEEYIIMTGFRNDVHSILHELDLFLITSKTEGLGTSILDAFASGVPVVATRAGGIPEIITDNENGLLASVRDPAELAGNIIRLIRDADLRAEIIRNASRRVRSFSKERTAEETLKIYRQTMNGSEAITP
jgi:glycosyltransferase involved in cell wall biosynthesis